MDDLQAHLATAPVAASTVAAVHRRDHHHDGQAPTCHPHKVEVVHLGHQAVTVCHDCQSDSGFVPDREAEQVAHEHEELTLNQDAPLRHTTAA